MLYNDEIRKLISKSINDSVRLTFSSMGKNSLVMQSGCHRIHHRNDFSFQRNH